MSNGGDKTTKESTPKPQQGKATDQTTEQPKKEGDEKK